MSDVNVFNSIRHNKSSLKLSTLAERNRHKSMTGIGHKKVFTRHSSYSLSILKYG